MESLQISALMYTMFVEKQDEHQRIQDIFKQNTCFRLFSKWLLERTNEEKVSFYVAISDFRSGVK